MGYWDHCQVTFQRWHLISRPQANLLSASQGRNTDFLRNFHLMILSFVSQEKRSYLAQKYLVSPRKSSSYNICSNQKEMYVMKLESEKYLCDQTDPLFTFWVSRPIFAENLCLQKPWRRAHLISRLENAHWSDRRCELKRTHFLELKWMIICLHTNVWLIIQKWTKLLDRLQIGSCDENWSCLWRYPA